MMPRTEVSNGYLFDNEVYDNIIEKCELELTLSSDLECFVETELLLSMNEIMLQHNIENRINQAIFILFAQAIKTFKSCLILAINGYFTNTFINCRNIVEILFSIKYITEDPTSRLKRAEDYLTKKNYWADDNIRDRAYLALDKPLYQIYQILCNYSHANYMGTAQNYDGKTMSISPSEEKIKPCIEVVNSIYYYLLKYICMYYGICQDTFNTIQTPENFNEIIKFYESEKNIVDFVLNEVFVDTKLTEQQKDDWLRDFKKFTIDKKKKKK